MGKAIPVSCETGRFAPIDRYTFTRLLCKRCAQATGSMVDSERAQELLAGGGGQVKALETFSKWLEKYIEWIAVGLLLAVSIIVFVEVIARYGFKASSILREEMSRLFLCALCFLSYGYLWKRRHHIILDILFVRFGKRMQRHLWSVFHVIGLFISALWLWCGIKAIQMELVFESVSDAGIVYIWHYYIMVAGMGLLIFHIAEGFINHLREYFQKGV